MEKAAALQKNTFLHPFVTEHLGNLQRYGGKYFVDPDLNPKEVLWNDLNRAAKARHCTAEAVLQRGE